MKMMSRSRNKILKKMYFGVYPSPEYYNELANLVDNAESQIKLFEFRNDRPFRFMAAKG